MSVSLRPEFPAATPSSCGGPAAAPAGPTQAGAVPSSIEGTRLALSAAMLRRAPRIVGNADAADIGSLLDYIAERHALWSAHVSELVQELNRSTSTGRVPITPFMGAMTDALVEIEGSFSHLAQRVRDEEHEAAEKPGSARARDAMEG